MKRLPSDGLAGRRTVLQWLTVAPLTGVVAACAEPMGRSDAGGGDGGGADAAGLDDAGAEVCRPTTNDAQGPYYEVGAPARTTLAEASELGERIVLSGRVLSAVDCATPLAGYVLDLWQADANGTYYSGGRLRGTLASSADGTFSFESVMPGNYADAGGFRPAHIHAKVWTPGGATRLTTQIYFAGDAFLAPNDSCGPPTCNSGDPGRIVTLRPGTVGAVAGRLGELNLIVAP